MDSEPSQFIASKTWQTLNPAPPPVPWQQSIRFKVRIPKHAFQAWVTVLNRLPTRDRLRQWGSNISATCLLCNNHDEDQDHLFFRCSFSWEVWDVFFSHASFNPPLQFEAIINWLPSSSPNRKLRTICNLLIQALVYAFWKERNPRLHTSKSRTSLLIVKECKVTLKAKLIGLDRKLLPAVSRRLQQSSSANESYLQLWFRYFDA